MSAEAHAKNTTRGGVFLIVHRFCCLHSCPPQGGGSVRGEPLTGSPTRVQSPPAGDHFCVAKVLLQKRKTPMWVSFFFGAGDEESAEAPPVADEARRFRGSVPAVGCGSRRQPADTTVSAEGHTQKHHPIGWCFWSGRRGSNSLPGIPRMAVAIRRNPASPLDLTRFAQVEAAISPALRHISKKNTPSCRMGYSFWSGRR